MKRLLSIMRRYLKESILGPLFKLLEATLELLVPLVVAAIIDTGVKNADVPYIVRMSLLLIGFSAVGLAFSATAQYFAAKASVGAVSELRHDLFAHLGKFSYAQIDKLGTSTMITRITSDANQVQQGVNLTLRLLLRSPFVVFGAMIMAFVVDPDSALSFGLVIPVLSVIVFGIMLLSMPLYKRVQKSTDKVLGRTRQNLSGVRVIRAFCNEQSEIDGFTEENDVLTHEQKKVGKISALLNPLTYVIINLAILWLMHSGAIQVKSGELTQGQVIALYNYLSQILVELIKLANLIISITRALASAQRIADVLDIPSTEINGEIKELEASEYSVEFNNVSLRYDGAGDDSVKSVSFKVRSGDTVGIIGGTGSGKTSLVNLIPGFYSATCGDVLINGNNVKEYDKSALREAIGVVPQKAVLFKGTVRENLKWGNPNATDEQLYTALEIAQAKGVVDDKGGLDAMIEQGGRNLSGGQRQRLTIARALVASPAILVLDDSASALDYATDAALRSALKTIKNTTVFIVSQRTSSVMFADQIIVLDDGEAVGNGTHEELLSTCPVYKEIYDSQFRKED